MRILLISIFLPVLLLAPVIQAHAKGPKLELVYGEDLMKVPPLIKMKFQNDTGTSWEEASLEDRATFLNNWQKAKTADEQLEKKRAQEIKDEKKLLAQKEREKFRLKREEDRKARYKQKVKQAEEKEDRLKKKELNRKRNQAMRDLKRAQKAHD